MPTLSATKKLRVYGDCPYCGFVDELALTAGGYANSWNGGQGAYCCVCDSCGQAFAVAQDAVNDLQHTALVLLGEAD